MKYHIVFFFINLMHILITNYADSQLVLILNVGSESLEV